MPGRIRSIKPELLEDEKAAALSDGAWRLFVSSWLLADDHGNLRAGDRYLAAQVWQDTGKLAEARGALRELAAGEFLLVYEANGERYAKIRSWANHQRVDNAGKPRVPSLDKGKRILAKNLAEKVGKRPKVTEPCRLTPTTDNDPDHRPPTDDVKIWDAVTAQRAKSFPETKVLKYSAKRRSHVRARLDDFGVERVTSAVSKFYSRRFFWGCTGAAKDPDLLFRSTEQFEKVENASEYSAAPSAAQPSTNPMSLPRDYTAPSRLPPRRDAT